MPFLEWLLKYICLVCGYNYRSIELNNFSGPGPTGRRAADPEPERGRMYCDIACVCVSGSGERRERREEGNELHSHRWDEFNTKGF